MTDSSSSSLLPNVERLKVETNPLPEVVLKEENASVEVKGEDTNNLAANSGQSDGCSGKESNRPAVNSEKSSMEADNGDSGKNPALQNKDRHDETTEEGSPEEQPDETPQETEEDYRFQPMFTCCCGASFQFLGQITSHKKKQCIWIYVCPHCDRVYKDFDKMQAHKVSHHAVKVEPKADSEQTQTENGNDVKEGSGAGAEKVAESKEPPFKEILGATKESAAASKEAPVTSKPSYIHPIDKPKFGPKPLSNLIKARPLLPLRSSQMRPPMGMNNMGMMNNGMNNMGMMNPMMNNMGMMNMMGGFNPGMMNNMGMMNPQMMNSMGNMMGGFNPGMMNNMGMNAAMMNNMNQGFCGQNPMGGGPNMMGGNMNMMGGLPTMMGGGPNMMGGGFNMGGGHNMGGGGNMMDGMPNNMAERNNMMKRRPDMGGIPPKDAGDRHSASAPPGANVGRNIEQQPSTSPGVGHRSSSPSIRRRSPSPVMRRSRDHYNEMTPPPGSPRRRDSDRFNDNDWNSDRSFPDRSHLSEIDRLKNRSDSPFGNGRPSIASSSFFSKESPPQSGFFYGGKQYPFERSTLASTGPLKRDNSEPLSSQPSKMIRPMTSRF